MSQNTATTITAPLMVVCSGASSITTMFVMACLWCPSASPQQSVVLPQPLMLRDTRSVVSLATVLQQLPQSQLCCGSSTDEFFFRVEASTDLSKYVGICYGIWFLLLGYNVDAIFAYGGSTIRVFTILVHWSMHVLGISAFW